MQLTDDNTIAEGKDFLRDGWEKGVDCPCCKQRVQLYPVALSSGMARSLIALYKLDKEKPGYYHHSKFDVWRLNLGYAGGAFAKVRYWGLAVDQPNEDDPAKRTSGMWAITDKGRAFVEGNLTVPAKVKLFNKKSYGFDGNHINIREALGTKFDYQELMGGYQTEKPEQGSLL